jgi:hypothetical protein
MLPPASTRIHADKTLGPQMPDPSAVVAARSQDTHELHCTEYPITRGALTMLEPRSSHPLAFVRNMNLSQVHRPIIALAPKDFWTAFWETIRCALTPSFNSFFTNFLRWSIGHALLWHQGVAHGDISLKHLLFTCADNNGVLNDFDLTTTSNYTVNLQDIRRMHMPPFTPMELLRNQKFSIETLRYDHELESFAWVLAWVSRRVLDRKRLNEWLDRDNSNVYEYKNRFLVNAHSQAFIQSQPGSQNSLDSREPKRPTLSLLTKLDREIQRLLAYFKVLMRMYSFVPDTHRYKKGPTEAYIATAELLNHDILLMGDDYKQIVGLLKETEMTLPLYRDMQFLPEFAKEFKGFPVTPGNDIQSVLVKILMECRGDIVMMGDALYGTTPLPLPFGGHTMQDDTAVALNCHQSGNGTPDKGSELQPALKEGLNNGNSRLGSHERRDNPPTLDYEIWAECWIGICRYYCRQLIKGSEAPSTEKSNAEHLRTLIAACMQCAKIEPIAAVPIDINWVDSLEDF